MTTEERRQILDLVAAGKLSAAEAMTLLQGDAPATPPASAAQEATEQRIPVEEGVKAAKEEAQTALAAQRSVVKRSRWLHIHVNDLKSGERRVSVNVPLGLLQAGLSLGGRVSPELRRFSWDDISAALFDEQDGMIVEVKDEEDGEHVQIFID